MNDTMYKSKWHIIGQSVRGAQHERLGLPNQDAIKWIPESGGDSPLVLAVSDGHGSIESFRSDIGSELAVNCAIKVIRSFLKNVPNANNLFNSAYIVEEKLPQKIVHSWRSAVADNLATTPFRISELEKIEAEKGQAKRRQVILEPIITYGSTLLSVIIYKSYIIYLQLGDGDIITVSETGEATRPLPVDNRLFANETTSLCLPTAFQDFRVAYQMVFDQTPALILISTDGYSNSFSNDRNYLKVGTDILEIVRLEGLSEVGKNLKSWLTEASEKGSGDDITMGIICRTDMQKTPLWGLPSVKKAEIIEESINHKLMRPVQLPFKSIIEEPEIKSKESLP